ncbi:hypothetical protein GTG09_11120 [Roseobacter sp. HKCCD7328]|uniref:hypothetical protein n=1 Tax=Roseobacter sp. HKCCD7328 TaxID=2690493 RepID=UPI001491C249|nr:hypothetical protein [Roseobacter sp. HKCCD7328]NOD43608.1 hypothetical protein [Roseobacter sp. HKCCD7328]
MASILTVDGFDADAALAAVDGSDLNPVMKTTLSTAIEGARNNPELVEGVVTQVREALGL